MKSRFDVELRRKPKPVLDPSRHADPSAVLKGLPNALSTPELNIACREGEQHTLIETLQNTADFPDAEKIIRIDGLRVEYADGFGLARASNTTPVIVLRFEADSQPALERIQHALLTAIRAIKPDATLATSGH